MTDTDWKPTPFCCWCRGLFELRTIDDAQFYVCATEACAERQFAWRIDDADGKLFHLPSPKQVELDDAIAKQDRRYICIGGCRGGGKSVGLRRIAYRYCLKYKDFNVLFLRRLFTELLRNHVQKAHREAKRFHTKITSYKMPFPETDALIEFGHMQNEDDWKTYVGAEYDLIVIDQLELFTEKQISEVSACLGRTKHPGWRGLMLAGENPGGPLAQFVDDLFISKKRDRKKYPKYNPDHYLFIPAQLEDNPYVDEDYVDFLAGLEPEKRDMYRWGRRDVFPGKFFPDWQPANHVRPS